MIPVNGCQVSSPPNEQVDLEISQSLVEAQLPTRDLFGRVCVN